MDNDYLRRRTDQILREKILLGVATGGAAPKRCARGSHKKCVRTTRKAAGEGVLIGGEGVRRKRKVQKKRKVKRAGVRAGVMAGEGYHECNECHCGYGEGISKRKVRKSGSKTMKRASAGYGTKKGARHNPWVQFLKQLSKENGIPYNEYLKNPQLRKQAQRMYHGM